MHKLKQCLSEESGKISASRAFMYGMAGFVLACWLGVGIWIVWHNWGGPEVVNLWSESGIGEWMDWGKATIFASIVPYLVNKGAGAMKERKP